MDKVDDILAVQAGLAEHGIRVDVKPLCYALGMQHLESEAQEAADEVAFAESLLAEDAELVEPFATSRRLGDIQIFDGGGYGKIARGWDETLGRPVAIKFLRGDAAHEQIRERFEREILITAQLEHPGIVPVYDRVIDRHNRVCLVMRLIEGCTLQDAIEFVQQDRMPRFTIDGNDIDQSKWSTLGFPSTPLQLIDRWLAVCDTVAYAHEERRVVHRDLKPNNIDSDRLVRRSYWTGESPNN